MPTVSLYTVSQMVDLVVLSTAISSVGSVTLRSLHHSLNWFRCK